MPQIVKRTSVAGATTVVNDINTETFRTIGGRGAQIRMYCSIDGLRANGFVTLMSGSDVLVKNAQPSVDGNEETRVPDHQIASGIGLPGDELSVELRNTHATTAIVFSYVIDIENA